MNKFFQLECSLKLFMGSMCLLILQGGVSIIVSVTFTFDSLPCDLETVHLLIGGNGGNPGGRASASERGFFCL